ncbi:MAG: hydroxyisourate hydrolase [Elusimicrobia bacterium]|nr:hydroxyisourate hydrolase [Elusimicrobiota bacterium]
MSPITTHVLDVSLGRPAAGVPAVLEAQAGADWKELGRGVTDADGRIKTLLPDAPLAAGVYRLTFDTGTYFAASKTAGFYPSVAVTFEVRKAGEHYHVPLLLSPFGYSTYRGS